MRLTPDEARDRFRVARVARLATINPDDSPHLVPIVFAWSEPDALVFAYDHKPKSGKPLKRLENLAVRPAVTLLVDEWAEDWDRLWWVRADGLAEVLDDADPRRDLALDALAARYPQYREVRPAGPVAWISVAAWSGWAASG
ncbi:MAG: TIGR03668 family PPOX class F420-dependent oxidoreductase [Sporichthyaceae bacterium]